MKYKQSCLICDQLIVFALFRPGKHGKIKFVLISTFASFGQVIQQELFQQEYQIIDFQFL